MKTTVTYWARIFCGLRAGYSDEVAIVEDAMKLCQQFVDAIGLCVTVEQTHFIYKGDDEPGVIIGLINYPRFPKSPEQIRFVALELATHLKRKFKQIRMSVMFPDKTVMLEEDD